jgi:ligand-binding sensor domain-containing protein
MLLSTLKAFTQQYNFINYSIEDGLVQSQIQAISQDNDGYIWVGTLGGLSKFDGVNFENYSTKDGLLNNQIDAIFNDAKGDLWFGTQGGVSVYNGTNFKSYEFKNELAEIFVLSITQDNKGKMWFATDGGGLITFKDSILDYINLPNGEESNYVRHVYADKKGNVWAATRNGVVIIDSNLNVTDTIKNVNATQVYIDEKQQVWCSTFGNGVFKISGGKCVEYNVDNGLISNQIRGFAKRSDGSFWFVSKNGISKLEGNTFKNFTNIDGLKDVNIKCIKEGIQGTLFFGSDGAGLIKFINEDFLSYTESSEIGSNVIMSVLEDNDKNFWFSTYGDGVTMLSKTGSKQYTVKDGLGNNTVWCSMLTADGKVWFGTSNGFSVFNGKGFKSYTAEHGLNAKKVFVLKEISGGNIIIGTKEGASIFNPKNDSIFSLDIGRNVRDILIENNEVIWFCSSDGLFKYNLITKEKIKYDDNNGLPSISVMAILKDKEDRYWVGTKNGLAFLKKNKFYTVEIPDNFSANNINFLQLDKFNNLWIGTNYGLYKLNIANKNNFKPTDFVRYSNLDGLKSLECNQNSAYIDNENNLWFGTSYGLMKHKLSQKGTKYTMPLIEIKEVRLFFEKQDLSKYAKGIDEKTKLPKDLVLTYNKNHLTFDFIGIYHANPDNVKYRFKLDGFDEKWQPVTKETYVTYSNIPAGDFTFQISATSDLNYWTEPVSFSFTVKPPFWLTWWFYLLCGLTFSGLVWLIIKRKQKVENAKRATQLIVDKSKMLTLEQQALNASMNRHFIFNALNSIQYYINRQDKIAANRYLSSFAKLVRKNLDSSLVNEIYLDEEIERIDLYLKLEQMRFQDKFEYKINIDKNIEPQTLKIPSMLLQPFIENSIWHGILPSNRPGNILIDVVKREDKLIITITDDGIGIEKSLEDKKDKKQHHESQGMKLTKGRVNLLSKISNKDSAIRGPYQIYNEKNEIAGTEVSIILSL